MHKLAAAATAWNRAADVGRVESRSASTEDIALPAAAGAASRPVAGSPESAGAQLPRERRRRGHGPHEQRRRSTDGKSGSGGQAGGELSTAPPGP